MKIAVFDTKPHDKEFLAHSSEGLDLEFFETRLNVKTASLAKGAEGVCVFVNDVVDKDCLETLHEEGVRQVALRCAGFNNVDIQAAKELGMKVTRVPEYSPHAVAEHTVALLLTLNRRIHRAHYRVREQNFSLTGLVGFDLFGKSVGIIGGGKIGRITAEIFQGFGCKVSIHDPCLDEEWAGRKSIASFDLNDLLKQSHIISLHVPLTDKSYHLIDTDALAKMRKGSYLVNTSRGKLVDSRALISALKSRSLGGVALDVYEEEEGVFFEDLSSEILDDDKLGRLLTFPNVLITAHQAFLTKEALTEIAETTCENFRRSESGRDFLEGTELGS